MSSLEFGEGFLGQQVAMSILCQLINYYSTDNTDSASFGKSK